MSEDGLTWTFTLRDGVLFHDGTEMTAETVLNALDIARGKPGPLNDLPITGIAAGDGTLTVSLSEPVGALPAYLAYFPLSDPLARLLRAGWRWRRDHRHRPLQDHRAGAAAEPRCHRVRRLLG